MIMSKNKLYWLLIPVITLCILTSGLPAQVQAESPEPVDVLVTFYYQPGPDEIELIESLGGTVTTVYHIVPTIAVTVPSDAIDELENDPRVELVELDIVVAGIAGQVLPWGVDRVDAELVHPSNKGTGVKIAILDTGVDLDHPDLQVAGDVTFIEGTTSGDDDNGHGTLVAGIIGALDNDIGVIGVAPEASLYSVKVLKEDGTGPMSSILSGIEWSVDNNMQVINMSFGGGFEWTYSAREALQIAYDSGTVMVAGAGNGGAIWSPARYQPVIAVGATDEQDALYNSSTGYTLELVAPGANIYSTAMGGDYAYLNYTSASSPHVAGVAALLTASGITDNADVRYRLRNSAEDLGESGWDTQYGCGMVNADLAINFTEPPDQSAPITTITLNGTKGNNDWYLSDVEVVISATDDGGSGVAETKYSIDGGASWHTYTSPLSFTEESADYWDYFHVMARSWDNDGNDEGPPPFARFQIDKTPPVVTVTVDPTEVMRVRKGEMFSIAYDCSAEDAVSGWCAPYTIELIDEYEVYDQDLGYDLCGAVSVEAWCEGWDKDGRTYTIRMTARDRAGNVGQGEDITTVLHP
jgi:subtilisin